MYFEDETSAILGIADHISTAAGSLFTATKYIYALADSKYYECDIKDVFRIILNNIREPQRLSAFRLDIGSCACAAMETPAYEAVRDLILYSFAVRVPVLGRSESGAALSDEQVQAVYETVLLGHAVNPGGFIKDSFEDIRKSVKKRRPLPPYKTDWYRAYIYARCPALADISNKNIFLLGAAEPLFSMFYLQQESELRKYIAGLSKNTAV